jgi:malto-oligosyltrehalose synthase
VSPGAKRSPATLGSTYRLQLNGLGFESATELVPYLDALGIETLYCSPITRAVPGSPHGYDVADPTQLDPALGSRRQFEALLVALDSHGMRLLIDIVPNHMTTDRSNAWWWDVLRQGQASAFSDFFDIDWSRHDGRVLVPTLGQPLADVVRDAHPAVAELDGELVLSLGPQPFPLAPGTSGAPGALSELAALDLLGRQHYLPAYWRLAGDFGNYRRFFDINGLVGVRVEDPEVRLVTHALMLELLQDERVAGLRIDHIDGLAQPGSYLETLRSQAGRGRASEPVLLVEKILEENEALPPWPVDGTTGYEFADLAGALFIDRVLADEPFWDLALAGKRAVLAASFGGAIDRLVHLAASASASTLGPGALRSLSLSPSQLRPAIIELTVHLDVYRTYLEGTTNERPDERRLVAAADAARHNLSDSSNRALGVLVDGLLAQGPEWSEFTERWQQLTGAVTAKGVEDTATYQFDGPLGHAEVGSRADRAPVEVADFVTAMRQRLTGAPLALNTTSTHDAKRNEDLRARHYALTEWWPEWLVQLARWRSEHAEWVEAHGGPDAPAMDLAYQTLVALWPTDAVELDAATSQRVEEYLIKAAREAKLRTSWSDPDETYEAALVGAVRFLGRSPDSGFGTAARAWSLRLAPAAATTSLALTLLKAVCPGVPDTYQGNELVQYALTDPDNRRPVDFDHRRALLDELDAPAGMDRVEWLSLLLGNWTDGRLKLHVLRTALRLRRRWPDLFRLGTVDSPTVIGAAANHVVALSRHWGDRRLVAVMPRRTRSLVGEGRFALGRDAWGAAEIVLDPAGPRLGYVDVLTGRTYEPKPTVSVAELAGVLPVALLVDQPGTQSMS